MRVLIERRRGQKEGGRRAAGYSDKRGECAGEEGDIG